MARLRAGRALDPRRRPLAERIGHSEYIAAVQAGGQLIAERRILSRQDGLEEALFTRLRLTEGIDLELVESRYGVDVWREYGGELQPFVEAGL